MEPLPDMQGGWADLPTTILEDIFELLPLKNLGRCSQVCYNWFLTFHRDRAFRRFQFKDNIFVRRKFTQHSGWQYHIDHWKLRFLITNAARKWRELEIVPVTNLFNLYEFIRVLTNFSEYYEKTAEDKPLAGIRSFRFEWKMIIAEDDVIRRQKVVGTGGEMLKSLISLLDHLLGIKTLSLINIQLEAHECRSFVERIWTLFGEQLEKLFIVNASRYRRPLMHVGLFLKLRKLVLSPQHLDDDVLILIGDMPLLEKFMILQNDKTTEERACSPGAWQQFKESSLGRIRLYICNTGRHTNPLLIQPNAPVNEIIFGASCGHLLAEMGQEVFQTVKAFGRQEILFVRITTNHWRSSSKAALRDLGDLTNSPSGLIFPPLILCTERVSNSTAMILAQKAGERGTRLCLRRNALLKRNCWSISVLNLMDINLDQRQLRQLCKDYDKTIQQINAWTGCVATVMNDQRYKSALNIS